MTQSVTDTTSDAPSAVTVAGDVIVADAFVDWELNCSNTPELCAIVSEAVPKRVQDLDKNRESGSHG